MKKNLFSALLFFLLASALTLQAQTARKFTINLTDDGAANMVVFLPEKPAGRAIVGIPGGGYSMLSNTHEGYAWSGWLNERGIAYCVVNYRMPKGNRSIPIGDVEKGFRIVRHRTRLGCGMGHQPLGCRHHGILGRRPSGFGHLHSFPLRTKA